MSRQLLVVDDNRGCSELYKMRFEIAKWEVRVAYSAEQALKMLEDGYRPDAMLLDVMLPKMQGDELTKVIKNNPATKDIIVIILTALNLSDKDQSRICEHADACLLKINIMPKELVEKVTALVDSKSAVGLK